MTFTTSIFQVILIFGLGWIIGYLQGREHEKLFQEREKKWEDYIRGRTQINVPDIEKKLPGNKPGEETKREGYNPPPVAKLDPALRPVIKIMRFYLKKETIPLPKERYSCAKYCGNEIERYFWSD